MRLFLALSITEEWRNEIADNLEPLGRRLPSPVRWIPSEHLHFTLRFFGDVGPALKSKLEPVIEEAAGQVESFSLQLGGTGAFPNLARARVLWVGLEAGDTEARHLASCIEDAIAPLEFKPEKRFHPHITVGRVKSRLDRRFLEKWETLSLEPLTMRTDHVALIKSRLTPQGAKYEVLRRFPLA